jgi:hypothetical protein
MFRLLLRFSGLCLLATAFAMLTVDVTRSVADGRFKPTPIGETLMALSPAKLAAAQVFVEHHVHPFIWNPLLLDLMRLPVWLGVGAVGGLVAWLGKKPAPKFGFASR